MAIETSKNLGGVGAILMFISFIPWTWPYGWILALVGLILALIGFKGVADYYKETGIFNNALYAFIAAIVGAVITGVVVFTGLVGFLSEVIPNFSGISDLPQLSQADFTNISWDAISGFLAIIAVAWLVLFVFVLIATVLLRKSLASLSVKTGIGLFGTTGIVMLIGGVLAIIAVGYLLIWVGFLLLAVAFFQIRPQQPQPATSAAAPI